MTVCTIRQEFSSLRCMLHKGMAEFFGTYILVLIGNGSIAQWKLSASMTGENFLSVNFGWALGVILGLLVSANISGGHLNPAVTLAMALSRRFAWKNLPIYWLSQYLGAMAASGTVFGIYQDVISPTKIHGLFRIQLNPDDPGSAAIFANYPAAHVSTGTALAEEIVATAVFMLIICVVGDKRYTKIPAQLQPFYIGFAMLAIGVSYGTNAGYGLNPARDLAPRLVTFVAGWGQGVFSFRGYNWFWIFIVGPHIGAIIGVVIFRLLLIGYRDDPKSELPELQNVVVLSTVNELVEETSKV